MQKLCCVCKRQQYSASLDYFVTSSPPYLHQFSTIFGGNCINSGSNSPSAGPSPSPGGAPSTGCPIHRSTHCHRTFRIYANGLSGPATNPVRLRCLPLQKSGLTEFRQPLQVQSHLEMPRILVQLGNTQRTWKLDPQTDPKWSPTWILTRFQPICPLSARDGRYACQASRAHRTHSRL